MPCAPRRELSARDFGILLGRIFRTGVRRFSLSSVVLVAAC
jgi:hypothetical protein